MEILENKYVHIAGTPANPGIITNSFVDGPGIRLTLFTQGCVHHCKGCQNPETHSFKGGYYEKLQTIYDKVMNNKLCDGITLSGGDPLYQAAKLLPLVDAILQSGKSVVTYTGFVWEDVLRIYGFSSPLFTLLRKSQMVVDGPFILSKRNTNILLRGSTNQRLIDVNNTNEGKISLFGFDIKNIKCGEKSIIIETSTKTHLVPGDKIEIINTNNYNGIYIVGKIINDNVFTVCYNLSFPSKAKNISSEETIGHLYNFSIMSQVLKIKKEIL